MNDNSPYNWLRAWSAAVAFAGFSAVVSLPAISQTSPSPTPEVSPSPTPEASPSPTPEVSPSPTPEASPSPTPEVSPSPAPTEAAPPTSDRSLTQLLQQASGSGSFTILARAVQAAGVAGAIQSGGSYTIFAPTDAAFSALPSGVLEKLLLPQNKALLAKVLAYHVAPEALTSSELKTGGLKTLGGGVAIRVTSDRVIVNNGSVVQADIKAGNGVVHAVNRVLLPRQLRQKLASL